MMFSIKYSILIRKLVDQIYILVEFKGKVHNTKTICLTYYQFLFQEPTH